MKTISKHILIVIVAIFACIGVLFSLVFIGMQFGIFDVRGTIADRNAFFGPAASSSPVCVDTKKQICDWTETPEWAVIKAGFLKDQTIIERVSTETGVPPRIIASVVVPEQIRFFTSEREIFKRYFEPLKILGSMSKFSLGISGIKQDTASMIEEFAASTTSAFYPGPEMSALIVYPTSVTDRNAELFNRLTDAKNHYYSYLYTAIYIKEIEAQWKNAGYDISQNPGVITTLFNIGFQNSHPNANPESGGSPVTTGGTVYNYGKLGTNFYNSNELPMFSK
ncbi:MAG: hypothetical protein JWO50_781 [Candidatus Kaiserbacteria bacterium]|nr:hypothetical protein [Candidatus Kaiserbacteria bacterium]